MRLRITKSDYWILITTIRYTKKVGCYNKLNFEEKSPRRWTSGDLFLRLFTAMKELGGGYVWK